MKFLKNEKQLNLEQLRWLDNKFKIKVGITEFKSQSVDTTEDIDNSDGCDCTCDTGWIGDDCSILAGDVNSDGLVNVLDVVKMVNEILNPPHCCE